MTELFRAAAVENKRPKIYGTILLRYSWQMTVFYVFFAACSLASIVGFFTLGFARTELMPGVALPAGGLIDVQAPAGGAVQSLHAAEGARVQKGDLLLVIRNTRNTTSGDVVQKVGKSLAQQHRLLISEQGVVRAQGTLKEDMTQRDIARIEAELVEVDQQIRLQSDRVTLSEEVAHRLERYDDPGVVPAFMLAEKKADALDQRLRLQELQRQRLNLSSQRDALQLQRRERALERLRDAGGVAQNVARLEQDIAENDWQGTVEVRANESGTLVGISVQAGNAVTTGQSLLHILPDSSQMNVELYAPPRAIGQLRAGMPVQIRYDAFPFERYGQFPGIVRDISMSPINPAETGRWIKLNDDDQMRYRVRVDVVNNMLLIDGQRVPLQPGMLLHASVNLEYRRLYEWALKPLKNAAQGGA